MNGLQCDTWCMLLLAAGLTVSISHVPVLLSASNQELKYLHISLHVTAILH